MDDCFLFDRSNPAPRSTPVRAAFRIQTLICNSQPLDWPSANQMLLDNCNRIFGLHAAVPDCLWINHHGGTMLALIQAP
jgi:hypothetical protein